MTGRGVSFPDLGVRVLSAAVLVAVAAVDFWQGGVWVTLLVALATALMLWEFRRIVLPAQSLQDPALWAMIAAGTLCVAATGFWSLQIGLACLLVGAAVLAFSGTAPRRYLLPGLIYVALAMAFLVELRRDPVQGLPMVLWLVSVVIAADVGGYFAGRTIGGPKLWPRVSPNKTWAGAIGGLVLALGVGVAFTLSARMDLPQLVLLSGIVALASQGGDLAESWLKRRFGVKDSSALIPGHGGLLDRFDGLLGALWLFGGLYLSGMLSA